MLQSRYRKLRGLLYLLGTGLGIFTMPVHYVQAGFFDLNVTEWFAEAVGWLGFLFVTLAAKLVWLGGTVLDQSVRHTILNMADFVNGNSAIDAGWTVLRDFVNLGFIFILLYIALMYIFNADSSQTAKTLRNVIIVALLINFSLFATKFVIDTSNILSIGIYNQIIDLSAADIGENSIENGSGISYPLVENLGVTAGFSAAPFEAAIDSQGDVSDAFIFSTLTVLMMLVTAGVLFTIGIMLIIRFVVLLFCLIISPIAIAAFAVPGLQSHGIKWLQTLVRESFFAPIIFLFIWIDVRIMQASDDFLSVDNIATVYLGKTSTVSNSSFLSFLIIAGILIGSVIVARKISSVGGERGFGYARRLSGGFGRRPAGFAGRVTLGRIGAEADERLARSSFGSTIPGNALRQMTTRPLANARWGTNKSGEDTMRHTRHMKANRKLAGESKPLKNALRGNSDQDAREQLRLATAAQLRQMNSKDLENNAHLLNESNMEAIEKMSDEEIPEETKTAIRERRYREINQEVNNVQQENTYDNRRNLQSAIKRFSGNELAKNIPQNTLQSEHFQQALDAKKVKELKASNNISEEIKNNIDLNITNRFQESENIGQEMNGFGDITQIPDNVWNNRGDEMIQHMDGQDMQSIVSNAGARTRKAVMNKVEEQLKAGTLSDKLNDYFTKGAGAGLVSQPNTDRASGAEQGTKSTSGQNTEPTPTQPRREQGSNAGKMSPILNQHGNPTEDVSYKSNR